MYPVLFKISSFELHTWSVCFAISTLAGIIVAVKRASRLGVKPDTVIDLTFIILISSVVGSRIWYVIYHIDEFKGNWLNVVNPLQNGHFGIAGFSMIGGIALAILTSLTYTIIKKFNFFCWGM